MSKSTKRKSIGAVKTCGDCGSVILPTSPQIRCDQCKKSFHSLCKKIDEKVCRKLARDKTPWHCDDCASDDEEDEEEEEDIDTMSIKKILAAIQKQLTELTSKCNEISALKKKCNEISTSQQYLSDSHDTFITQIKQCTEENKHLRDEVTALTKKCSLLSNEMEQIKSQVNAHEQAKLSSKVLIRGIKVNDDPLDAVNKIATIIEMQGQIKDTVTAKRLTYQNREPVIVVEFNDEHLKRQFVKEAKKKRISTQMFGYEGEIIPIYVDEQLTRQTFLLFKYAKKLKKIGCQYVWIANGDIMARINATSQFVKITQKHQVDEMEKELLTKPNEQKNTDNNNKKDKTHEKPKTKSADNPRGKTNTSQHTNNRNESKQRHNAAHTNNKPNVNAPRAEQNSDE